MTNPSVEAMRAAERIAAYQDQHYGPISPGYPGPTRVSSVVDMAEIVDAEYAALRIESQYNAAYFNRHAEGEDAQANGMTQAENPHMPLTLDYEAWDDGWRCAAFAALRERVERLERALTPSADTKAAYIGEFKFNVPEFDQFGIEHSRDVAVPWHTIKEIMAAIRERVALSPSKEPTT